MKSHKGSNVWTRFRDDPTKGRWDIILMLMWLKWTFNVKSVDRSFSSLNLFTSSFSHSLTLCLCSRSHVFPLNDSNLLLSESSVCVCVWALSWLNCKIKFCGLSSVSQMVIEEVNVLQTQLEIEKSCRENAEALATKVTHTHTHSSMLSY